MLVYMLLMLYPYKIPKNVPYVIALAVGKEKSPRLKALHAQQVIAVLIIDQIFADGLQL